MAISFVGSVTGTTSATLPAHQAGDVIVAFAFNDGATTIPTLGSGFTSTTTRTGTLSACIVGYRRATVTNTASGTWTNATSVIFVIYRNVGSIGGSAVASGTSTSITFPAVTLTNQTGSSWIVGFVGSSSTNVAIETAPSGMINRTSVSDATDEAAAHDTNSGLSSFTSKTATIGGTSGNWVSATLELIDGSATATITGIQATSSLDNFSFINTNWWQFFFEQGLPLDGFVTSDWHAFFFERGAYLEALGQANKQLSGFETSSAFASISAIGQTNATASVTSSQAVLYFSDLIATVSDSEIVNGIEAIAYISEISTSATANNLLTGLSVNSDFSELLFQASSNLSFDGIETSTELGNFSITISDSEIINGIEAVALSGQTTASADAYFEQSGLSVETDIAEISELADANIAINGNELDALFDAVSVTADSIYIVSGKQSSAEIGEVTASAVVQINATAEFDGIGSNASIGDVLATTENPEVWQSSGQIKRYPANHIVNATAKLSQIVAYTEQSDVFVSSTVQINATIALDNVVSFTQVANINADGILSISDDELILLMAA